MFVGITLLSLGTALLGYLLMREPTAASAKQKSSMLGSTVRESPSESGAPETSTDEPLHAPWEPKVVLTYESEVESESEEKQTRSGRAPVVLRAFGDTDRGQHRRANDDSLLLASDRGVFAVADGMGGYAGGNVASSLAVETLKRAFDDESFTAEVRSTRPIPRDGRELASAMLQAHEAVFRAARANPAHCRMGTTLVAARFSPRERRVYIGHVGDSRCYRLRRGSLRQLTCDQTLSTVGLRGPRAGDLLQAVGVTRDLSLDLLVDQPEAGDIYLLCSDGLNKMISDSQIARVLAEHHDLEATLYELIERANDAGGRDNVTVVLIKVLDRSIHDVATIPSPPPRPFDSAGKRGR